jgi:hypothetical protein
MRPTGRPGWLIAAVLAIFAGTAQACDFLVRDSAFRMPREVHRLCLMAAAGDPAAEEIARRLTDWLARDGADFNAELVQVDVHDDSVEWASYGIPTPPPSVPVVVLVGRNGESGRSFVIDHWEPAPTDEDLHALAHSPLREALQRELGRHLAVVLYAPCSNCETEGVRALLRQAEEHWRETAELGVKVLEVDRTDPAERLLLRFAGITAEGPDWVGVVFARGKLMNPPLVGDAITADGVNALVEQVLAECSCSKPLLALGVDLPLLWPAALDEAVVELSDPDPNVVAAMSMSGAEPKLVAIPAGAPPQALQAVIADAPAVDALTGGDNSRSPLALVVVVLGLAAIAIGVWVRFGRRPA